jgi:hypothetical protein
MRVEHTLTVVVRCPVDDRVDVYEAVVRTGRLLKVEGILAVAKRLSREPAFQEHLTRQLADELGCEVQTCGWHSGVKTVVVCGEEVGPPSPPSV